MFSYKFRISIYKKVSADLPLYIYKQWGKSYGYMRKGNEKCLNTKIFDLLTGRNADRQNVIIIMRKLCVRYY